MQTVVGIDLGTQNLKIVFYDYDACRVVVSESLPLDLIQNNAGVAEQKAHWWTDALCAVLANVDQGVRESVIAIGVSGQQHGFVPLDKSGEVLAAVKLWCDTSTEPECREIMQTVGGADACLALTGNPILPVYTASKILRFRKAYPDLYGKLATILLPHDYLNFYLTGERCMEAGDASGTGFLNIRNRSWSTEILQAIDPDRDLSECLPELRMGPDEIGRLSNHAADALGLPVDIPVSSGGGDNMMAAIGTGNVSPGKITMSLGTSGTVYAYSDEPIVDSGGDIAAFCSSTGGWLPLLCTMNCTVATESMRQLFASEMVAFEEQIASATPGSGGVITLPFFNGERTPNLPQGKACVIGLDSQNTRPENFLRSAMEGATYALRFGLDKFAELDITADEIVLTGGGSNSPSWRQLVANVCAAPVTILQQKEGAAFGAALQALLVTDAANGVDINTLVAEHLTRDELLCCKPEADAVSFYQDAYGEYEKAVAAVSPLFQQAGNSSNEALR